MLCTDHKLRSQYIVLNELVDSNQVATSSVRSYSVDEKVENSTHWSLTSDKNAVMMTLYNGAKSSQFTELSWHTKWALGGGY